MLKVKPHVLIIDDDQDILDTLQILLESEGFQITTCTTGKEAQRQLEQSKFSAILIDIFLPDYDGLDFIKKVQQQGLLVPFVIITGSSEIEMARKAIKLGVFDYLVKPIKNRQLIQVVRNAVTHYFLQEERQTLEKQKRLYQEQLEKLIDQKASELEESEYKYKSLVEQSFIGVFVMQDHRFQYLNTKAYEVFGIEPIQAIDRKGLLDFVQDENGRFAQMLQDCIDGKTSHFQRSIDARTLDGEHKVLQLWIARIQYKKRPALEGIVIDITEQVEYKKRERLLELQLMNAHKMAAIGNLAAGIAHNLNNPIAIIQANAELLKMKYPDSNETKRIIEQTRRMIELINTIVMKGRREQRQILESIDLNQLIRRELEFLNANLFFKHQVQKKFNFKEGLPKVKGRYSDFSQSFNNLIDNAIDAMRSTELKQLTISTDFDGRNIILEISDTGCGIEKQNLEKIFEPFFTTKRPPSEDEAQSNVPTGSGLGLPMVKMLLEPYKVKIKVDSEPGRGTTVILNIPVVAN